MTATEPKTETNVTVMPKAETAPQGSGDTAQLISIIDRAIHNPDLEVERIEKMFELYERAEDRAAEKAFAEAFNGAQIEMGTIVKDKKNKHTGSNYATFLALDRAIKPIYTKHGFSCSFTTLDNAPEGHIRVGLTIRHRAGHKETYQVDMPINTTGPQGKEVMTVTHATGSAQTYGKRYLYILAWNLALADSNDDDGNAAGGNASQSITTEQAHELENLIRDSESDRDAFMKYVGVTRIEDVPARHFDKLKAKLNKNLTERMGA